jgi:putative peptide zinc metalloprotease protein
VLNPENLPWLYVSMVLIKVVHEFGHAFACKRFGLRDGSGGEVHVMGVMFLVFAPLPYMDASSAWAFRSKWRRIVVGAAGMIVELGFAAVAAVVWAYSAKGTTVSAICYNVMFIASVSTVLFNGNPLLRYDAYYMLSDLLEIPNLAQRSRTYVYYLVRKYVWGVRHVQDPSHTRGEKGWLAVYALASLAYRVVICIGILVFVADKLFIVGAIMAVAAVVAWVCVPIVKFVHYLATSGELTRVRARAVATTGAVLAAVLVLVGGIPLPDHYRVEGIVEPVRMTVVYGGADGFVEDVLPSGEPALSDFAVQSVVAQGAIALSSASWASGGPTCPAGLLACVPYFQDPNSGEPALRGPLLVRAVNPELESKRDELAAELRRLTAERRLRQTKELAEAQILGEQIASMGKQIRRCDEDLKALEVHSPLVGQWVCPDARRFQKAYLKRGEPIGIVASLNDLRVRATAGQQVAAILVEESQRGVEIRVKGRPDGQYAGLVQKIHPAGQERLPSAALGFAAGGSMQTEAEDRSGTKASERFFEIQVALDAAAAGHFMPGQRVVVRFQVQDKPLAQQAWRSILQFVQRRFHI